MGTQKPGEWANLVLARFEDQVRDWTILPRDERWSPCLRFLVVSCSPSPSPSPSPSRPTRLAPGHPLPVCGHTPPPPNVTSTMYPRYSTVCSSTPRQRLSWARLGGVHRVPSASFPPYSRPVLRVSNFELSRSTRGGARDGRCFSGGYSSFWINDCEDATDSRLHPKVGQRRFLIRAEFKLDNYQGCV